MPAIICDIENLDLTTCYSEETEEYTTSIRYASLTQQLGPGGRAMTALRTTARDTVKAAGYSLVNLIWVDFIVRGGVGFARLRIEWHADPRDTVDALGDRAELIANEVTSKIGHVKEILDRSRELAALGLPHEISSDPSRQNEEAVIFHPDRIATKTARALARTGLRGRFSFSVEDGEAITLDIPENGRTMVVDSTATITAQVEVIGLDKPHVGRLVRFQQIGGKRRIYIAVYAIEQYDLLHDAMRITHDHRFEVSLQPIINMTEKSTQRGKYHLAAIELIAHNTLFP